MEYVLGMVIIILDDVKGCKGEYVSMRFPTPPKEIKQTRKKRRGNPRKTKFFVTRVGRWSVMTLRLGIALYTCSAQFASGSVGFCAFETGRAGTWEIEWIPRKIYLIVSLCF